MEGHIPENDLFLGLYEKWPETCRFSKVNICLLKYFYKIIQKILDLNWMATTIDFVITCEGTKVWPLIFEIGKVSDYTKLFPDPLISCSYPVTHILDYVFHFDDYCYLTGSKKRFDQNLHVYQNPNHTLLGILWTYLNRNQVWHWESDESPIKIIFRIFKNGSGLKNNTDVLGLCQMDLSYDYHEELEVKEVWVVHTFMHK